ncbi:MAG TPA: hypothetical protein VKJ45_22800 [Blastocatellia bacterium]|nr:hypothetical protein [Blastocatellia bacterium]
MKSIATAIPIVALLVLAAPCFAQQPVPAENSIPGPVIQSRRPSPRPVLEGPAHFWLSSATFWGGFTVDALSSAGHAEANPLFKQQDSTANIGLNAAATGSFYVFTVLLQRRHPKAANIIRYMVGGVRIGVGIRNFNYKTVP